MNRRQFLMAGGSVTAAVVAGVSVRRAAMPSADIPALVAELQALRGRPLTTREGWAPFKVFSHLAQSIELSLTGYPELKPPFFRRTAGPVAFFVFSTAGAMRHPLTEPVPGASAIAEAGDTNAALDRLLQALAAFSAHTGPLAPHFAYGALDKAEYAQAHVMHVRDHLRMFDIAG